MNKEFIAGLRAARDIVENQTRLPDLIYFEKPSDFRKGVLTCLVAVEAKIKEALIEVDAQIKEAEDK